VRSHFSHQLLAISFQLLAFSFWLLAFGFWQARLLRIVILSQAKDLFFLQCGEQQILRFAQDDKG